MKPNTIISIATRILSITLRRPLLSAILLIALVLGIFGIFAMRGSRPGEIRYSLSPDAERAGKLIDAGSYAAALQVIHESLDRTKTDGGVLCQYSRCLIESLDPGNPGFIQSPLLRDGNYYWAAEIINRSAKTAVELDPEFKRYVADALMKSFAIRARKTLSAGGSTIGVSRDFYYAAEDEFRRTGSMHLSTIQACWTALAIDREIAGAWLPEFENLGCLAMERGKVLDCLMFGNFCGNLRSGEESHDAFKRSNKLLIGAIPQLAAASTADDLTGMISWYVLWYSKELSANPWSIDPQFGQLQASLKKLGRRITLPTDGNDEVP